jgi:hypothetical protein
MAFLPLTLVTLTLSLWSVAADPVNDYLREQMAERRIPGIALTVIQRW